MGAADLSATRGPDRNARVWLALLCCGPLSRNAARSWSGGLTSPAELGSDLRRVMELQNMGLTRARVRLANARRPDFAAIEVDALADIGALHLCIPEHVAIQLQLDELEKREITMADGSKRLAPYIGPIIVSSPIGSAMRAPWCSGTRPYWSPSQWRTWTSLLCAKSCKSQYCGIDRKGVAALNAAPWGVNSSSHFLLRTVNCITGGPSIEIRHHHRCNECAAIFWRRQCC